jgi:hypothetical protein
MVRPQIVMCMMAVVCAIAGQAMGDFVWDAYEGYSSGPTAQSSNNTWQYLQNPAHDVNTGYTLFDKWAPTGAGVDGWTSTDPDDGWFFVAKDTANGEIRLSPWGTNPVYTRAAVIGWKSTFAGVVNASFSVTDRNTSGGNDGVRYWLYKGGTGDGAWLEKGTVAEGGASGTIVHNSISVSTGDMLYLRVDPNSAYYCDLTGVTFSVSSNVPEPSALVLLGAGVAGMLAYAWRKRR